MTATPVRDPNGEDEDAPSGTVRWVCLSCDRAASLAVRGSAIVEAARGRRRRARAQFASSSPPTSHRGDACCWGRGWGGGRGDAASDAPPPLADRCRRSWARSGMTRSWRCRAATRTCPAASWRWRGSTAPPSWCVRHGPSPRCGLVLCRDRLLVHSLASTPMCACVRRALNTQRPVCGVRSARAAGVRRHDPRRQAAVDRRLARHRQRVPVVRCAVSAAAAARSSPAARRARTARRAWWPSFGRRGGVWARRFV